MHRHLASDGERDEPTRPRLGIVGAGQVGSALAVAFDRAGWPVTAFATRDAERRARLRSAIPAAKAFSEAAQVLDEVDICFLTVPDDAIAEVAADLRLYSNQGLVHTSGALPASVLAPAMAAGTAAASFHPLVAFADRDRALGALRGATVALEGDERLLLVLATLVEAIGAHPVRLPPGGKPAYHAAAVLAAGGFVGLLDAIAEVARAIELSETDALAVYGPLVRQALGNAEALGIDRALTGPLLRGDTGTIRGHLDALRSLAPAAEDLYLAAARRELAIAERRGTLTPERAQALRELVGS